MGAYEIFNTICHFFCIQTALFDLLGDGGVGRWIAFVLILLIGHTLNLLMCCLGAFVHPLRLNFLEYFKNSGYEGMGAKYNPLKNNN